MIKRGLRPFRRLQWKLTCSYALISMLAWLAVVILVLGAIWWGMNINKASILSISLQNEAKKAAPLVKRPGGVDQAGLESWLQKERNIESSLLAYEGSFTLTDRQGNVLASTGSMTQPTGHALRSYLSVQDAAVLQAQLHGQGSSEGVVRQNEQERIVEMVPIIGEHQQVLGVAVVQAHNLQIFPWIGFGLGLIFLLPTFLPFVLCIGIAATVFGYITSRRLVRRFQRLADVADHWSQGNFALQIYDPAEDELGQLARRLNLLATELQGLIQARQELATLQERGRMARDLHDSIKQQVFALYMQIKSAKSLLLKEREGTLPRLEQAELLIQQVQGDLTALIYELRPIGLVGKTFSQALREQVERWMQQTGIVATFQCEETLTLLPTLEDALYRFVQEALSNVVRHSQARTVRVEVSRQSNNVCVIISDDGQGFDIAVRAGKGQGLLSMRERLASFGGEFQLQSYPCEGTTVTAQVPSVGYVETPSGPEA